jgi:hypothetical protein
MTYDGEGWSNEDTDMSTSYGEGVSGIRTLSAGDLEMH